MSLINEALKKAQRQRTEAPVAMPPPPEHGVGNAPMSAQRIAKRRPPMPARTQILLLGGGGAVVLMAGVVAFIFFGPDYGPPVPAATPPVIVQIPAVAPASAPLDASTSVSAPPPSQVAVNLPTIAPVEPPVAPALPPPVAVVPSVPAAPVQPRAPASPAANLKVYEFIETMRVSGIRASDTDPKVIMNDRVFRLNDIVDRATQLRLIRVESNSLVFVDPSGYEYRKNF